MVKLLLFCMNIKMLMYDMFKLNEFKSFCCSKKFVYIFEKLVGIVDMLLNSKLKLWNFIFFVYIRVKYLFVCLFFFFN